MGIESNLSTPLAAAVRAAGSQSAFGRIVSRKQSTIFQWLLDNKPLPAELMQVVSLATGIPKEALRPDLFVVDDAAVLDNRSGVTVADPASGDRA